MSHNSELSDYIKDPLQSSKHSLNVTNPERISSSSDLRKLTSSNEVKHDIVADFGNIMMVGVDVKEGVRHKVPWKCHQCDEVESNFVKIKCEIEMMNAQSEALIQEIIQREKHVQVHHSLKLANGIFNRAKGRGVGENQTKSRAKITLH